MDDEDRTVPGLPPARKIAEESTVALDVRPPIADDITALGSLEALDRTVGTSAVPGFVAHAANADARTDLELEPPPRAPRAPSGPGTPAAPPSAPVDAHRIPPAVTATLLPGELPAVSPVVPDITAPMRKVPPSTPAPAPEPTRARASTLLVLVAAVAIAAGLWLYFS